MTYIPYTDEQWAAIEREYRRTFPSDQRKKLPIREVADWWASATIRAGINVPNTNGHIIKTVYLWRSDDVKIVWMNPDADSKNSAYGSSSKTLYELLFPGEGLPKGWT